MNKLEGTLLYVNVQQPTKAYIKEGQPPKPDEYKASVAIVDEDVIDAFEDYATSIGAKVSIKKFTAAEFPEKFKTDVPEGAGKKIWVVTLRKSTEQGKTGLPIPDKYRPRVFQRKGNALVDITNTHLVGNGSKGAISIEVFERNNNTASLYLKNVLVTDLIEYTQTSSDYEPGSEFDNAPVVKETKPTASTAPAAKAKAKKVVETAEIEDDDIPF